MNIEECRDYCLSLQAVEECFPFDDINLVFKVGGKMFALIDITDFTWVVVKCDPELAVELREEYPFDVTPAFHFNKKHWNSCSVIGNLSDDFIKKQIEHSYSLVRTSLPKKVQALL